MRTETTSSHAHPHLFHTASEAAERGTRAVMWITLVAMVVEIAAGLAFNSLALLADGWHMSSHALAIGLSAVAYASARRYAHDARFAFGTWKIEVLGGFASALFLLGVAALMVWSSAERLLDPRPIQFREAIVVAVLGLAVNLVCAAILLRSGEHGHHHHDGHDHGHPPHHHHDLNLRAAYMHVVADAATSVLAIVALAGGWWLGWSWLDPVMGLVGAALVAHWAWGLLRETGAVLLDREMNHPVVDEVRQVVSVAGGELADLHVWRVGQRAYSCAMTVVTNDPALDAQCLRERLAVHEEIVHSTIEVHQRG